MTRKIRAQNGEFVQNKSPLCGHAWLIILLIQWIPDMINSRDSFAGPLDNSNRLISTSIQWFHNRLLIVLAVSSPIIRQFFWPEPTVMAIFALPRNYTILRLFCPNSRRFWIPDDHDGSRYWICDLTFRLLPHILTSTKNIMVCACMCAVIVRVENREKWVDQRWKVREEGVKGVSSHCLSRQCSEAGLCETLLRVVSIVILLSVVRLDQLDATVLVFVTRNNRRLAHIQSFWKCQL